MISVSAKEAVCLYYQKLKVIAKGTIYTFMDRFIQFDNKVKDKYMVSGAITYSEPCEFLS